MSMQQYEVYSEKWQEKTEQFLESHEKSRNYIKKVLVYKNTQIPAKIEDFR